MQESVLSRERAIDLSVELAIRLFKTRSMTRRKTLRKWLADGLPNEPFAENPDLMALAVIRRQFRALSKL